MSFYFWANRPIDEWGTHDLGSESISCVGFVWPLCLVGDRQSKRHSVGLASGYYSDRYVLVC